MKRLLGNLALAASIAGNAWGIEFSGSGKTGLNNYRVNVEVTSIVVAGIERYELSGSILWDRGTVVEFQGEGGIDQRKIVSFTFKDDFGNEGKGKLYPVGETTETQGKNPHYITLEATKIVEPKAARQLFDYLLTQIK